MPTPIVEVGFMGVQPGKTPIQPKTPDGKILANAWDAVIHAPGGPQRIYWGLEAENPNNIWAWFDWNSLHEHEDFAKSFGGEVTSRFGEVFTPGFTKHAFLNTKALRSPVTQILLASFPSTITTAAQTAIAHRFSEFKDEALGRCTDVSCGWGLETDFPVRGDGSGAKGTLFVALVGWDSVNEYLTFYESGVFREFESLITGAEGCLGMSTFHIMCEVLERQMQGGE